MDKSEAIKYLYDNMNDDSILIGVTPNDVLNNNIDPKLIECCRVLNFSLCPNGTVYDKSKQSFMGNITETMYEDRKKYKNAMLDANKKYEETKDVQYQRLSIQYHNMQLAKKIQLNSLYGTLSNEYCRWFNFYHAESITKSGQTYIKYIDMEINKYLNKALDTKEQDYVIASDTDSVYLDLSGVVDKMNIIETEQTQIVSKLDEFCEKCLQPYINKQFKKLSDRLNVYSHRTEMKRETIANKGIWKAKKMYILNAWNIEGVQFDKPKLKIQGIEAVRSSTPNVCRKYIKKALDIIMNESEEKLQEYISEIRNEYKKLPFEDVAFPRGVNNVEKYKDSKEIYTKGTPIHVKASLLYNNIIKTHNLKNIQPISNGDKIKYCYLLLPNVVGDTVIANADTLPKELEIDDYIDYNKQFEKSFIEPLKSITETIEWQLERKLTLERFFV